MIKPAEIVDALVTKLRAIEALVAELDGNADHIVAFHSRYPTETNLLRAVNKADPFSLIVAHRNSRFEGASPWRHQLEVYLRTGDDAPDDDSARAYSTLMDLMMDGIPEGQPVSVLKGDIHTNTNGVGTCDLVSVDFSYPQDEEGIEYARAILTFEERLGEF